MRGKSISNGGHVPVLLLQVLEGLRLRSGGRYLDGTFGRGGHSREILRRLDENGHLLVIDRDPQAIAFAEEMFDGDPRVEIVRSEFGRIREIVAERRLLGAVDGLLLDLGVSSPQLDQPGRGFSFSTTGPLDMRMDPQSGPSAADWLNSADEREMKKVFYELGEEKQAARIAKAIVAARAVNELQDTAQLAEIIQRVMPARERGIHPATRTFQAVRIFINDELGQLETALKSTADVLRTGGRLCVLSFHSLEDRIVKRFIRTASSVAEPYRGLPDIPAEFQPSFKPVGRVQKADSSEVTDNPRARSVRLRIAERL